MGLAAGGEADNPVGGFVCEGVGLVGDAPEGHLHSFSLVVLFKIDIVFEIDSCDRAFICVFDVEIAWLIILVLFSHAGKPAYFRVCVF